MTKTSAKLLVLLVLPVSLFGQQVNRSDWNAVDSLKPDTKIIVITKSGREFAGSKRKSADELLFMEVWSPDLTIRTISLTKNEIREVRKTTLHWVYKVIQDKRTTSDKERVEGADGCNNRHEKTIYISQ